jgi:hypothetical protein
MRQCPTLPNDERSLIAHTIGTGLCMERQRDFYHKCHRCMFRGKAADFALVPVGQNGAATAPTAAAAEEADPVRPTSGPG